MDRTQIADQIVGRLRDRQVDLQAEFFHPGRIRTFVVDDLLDEDLARQVHAAFPPVDAMMRRRSIREDKYVATQMDRYDPILEEVVFAFQEQVVVDAVADITGIAGLEGDRRLYAGGLSAMTRGQFLNPHIDNSHREDLDSYRILNLLYYATPGWESDEGGHLQLWDEGMGGDRRSVACHFNRLVVMATSTRSWHGVSAVEATERTRTCVSNYYFSRRPVGNRGEVVSGEYFHVTTFRGFPGQVGRNAVLVADGLARRALRRVFRRGVVATKQVYRRDES